MTLENTNSTSLNNTLSPAEKLRQDIDCDLYENNEKVIEGLCKNFEELFKLLPNLQARWRVWVFGFERLYFDKPAIDIRLSESSLWYQLSNWQTSLASETDIYHRRDGTWTQEKERTYIYLKSLPKNAAQYLYEIASYVPLFNFAMYGNLGFFEKSAQHWKKISAQGITKKTYGNDDALLFTLINKDNYYEALTEVYPQEDFGQKIKAQLEKDKLENGLENLRNPKTAKVINKI